MHTAMTPPSDAAAELPAVRAVVLRPTAQVELGARHYPVNGEPRAQVLIASAMGVRQDFYAPFARWLQAQGYAVMTFDYRGMGESRPVHAQRSLRGFRADLLDWAQDYDSAIAWLRAQYPQHPLYVVGHSLGAQLPGFLRERHRIDGLLSVAAGSGYWGDNAPPTKRVIHPFWHLIVPVLTTLYGYFPGRKIGKVGDLPKGVIYQWRRWCMYPRYHVQAEGEAARLAFADIRFPLWAMSMVDDEMMTERGTHVLLSWYEGARTHLQRIGAEQAQGKRVGHFGFFRAHFAQSLWPHALEAFGFFAQQGQQHTTGVRP